MTFPSAGDTGGCARKIQQGPHHSRVPSSSRGFMVVESPLKKPVAGMAQLDAGSSSHGQTGGIPFPVVNPWPITTAPSRPFYAALLDSFFSFLAFCPFGDPSFLHFLFNQQTVNYVSARRD